MEDIKFWVIKSLQMPNFKTSIDKGSKVINEIKKLSEKSSKLLRN